MCHLLVLWYAGFFPHYCSPFCFKFLCLLLYCSEKITNVFTLQVMFYETLKDMAEYGKKNWNIAPNGLVNSSMEGLVLGGLAGGMFLASFIEKFYNLVR